MQKLFTLIALSAATFGFADQYTHPDGPFGPRADNYNRSNGYSSNGYPVIYMDQGNYPNQPMYYDNGMQPQQYPNQNNQNPPVNAQNSKIPTDQEIGKEIQDDLSSGWFSKGFEGVKYQVNNGNVFLGGTIDTIENRNKLDEKIRKINGVRQVNNQIMIVQPNADDLTESQLKDSEKKFATDYASSFQDRQINAKIRNKLKGGWFSGGFEAIVVRTKNGFVVISGTVDKPADVQKINDQVKDVAGVRSISNQVSVKNK